MKSFTVAFVSIVLTVALFAINAKVLEMKNKVEVFLDLDESLDDMPTSFVQTALKENKVKSLSYSQKNKNKVHKGRKKLSLHQI